MKSCNNKDYGLISGEYKYIDDKGNLLEQGESKLGIKLNYIKWDSEGNIIDEKNEPSEIEKDRIEKLENERKESVRKFKKWQAKNDIGL